MTAHHLSLWSSVSWMDLSSVTKMVLSSITLCGFALSSSVIVKGFLCEEAQVVIFKHVWSYVPVYLQSLVFLLTQQAWYLPLCIKPLLFKIISFLKTCLDLSVLPCMVWSFFAENLELLDAMHLRTKFALLAVWL